MKPLQFLFPMTRRLVVFVLFAASHLDILVVPWPLPAKAPVTPIALDIHLLVYPHEVDDHVSVAPCPWSQANDPIAFPGVSPDFRLATRQRAAPEKRIRRKAGIVRDDV